MTNKDKIAIIDLFIEDMINTFIIAETQKFKRDIVAKMKSPKPTNENEMKIWKNDFFNIARRYSVIEDDVFEKIILERIEKMKEA